MATGLRSYGVYVYTVRDTFCIHIHTYILEYELVSTD